MAAAAEAAAAEATGSAAEAGAVQQKYSNMVSMLLQEAVTAAWCQQSWQVTHCMSHKQRMAFAQPQEKVGIAHCGHHAHLRLSLLSFLLCAGVADNMCSCARIAIRLPAHGVSVANWAVHAPAMLWSSACQA
jgi:hypothetical protein